jgi:hypothetical protein
MKNALLLDFLANLCHFAQEHISDPDAWSTNPTKRQELLEPTSYSVACFLAQNTVNGHEGVELEIVLDHLAHVPSHSIRKHNGMYLTSKEQWIDIINDLVHDLGGWKDDPSFGDWYKNKVGITVEQAKRSEVYDLQLMEDAWNHKD